MSKETEQIEAEIAEHRRELRLLEAVVAAHEGQHDRPAEHDRHGLRRRGGVDAQELGQSLDRPDARCLDLVGRVDQSADEVDAELARVARSLRLGGHR